MAAVALAEQPVVQLTAFGKSYRKSRAVGGVTFEVRESQLYGLIGPDGAGKSSVLKSVAGVQTFDEGSLRVFGIAVDSEPAAERIKAGIGFMPQGLGQNLYPELSVDENVDFFAELRGVEPEVVKTRKAELLSMTRLDAARSRPMKHLSGGMKQKLGLVCSLIHDPKLLILDEPTTGVDPVSRRDFWTILSQQVREKGITALISTAYLDEASRFDRISLFHNGHVIAEGTPAQITSSVPGAVLSIKVVRQAKALDLLRQKFETADVIGDKIRVHAPNMDKSSAKELASSVLQGFEIGSIEYEEPSLEDTFVHLTKGSAEQAKNPASAAEWAPHDHRTAISATHLTRQFDGFRAVDDVTFTVPEGQVFGLLGANGAGKTTVIKMLTGIVTPSSGNAEVAGVDMRRAGNAVKTRIGYVSQAFSLYQDLTVSENIRLYAGIYGLSNSAARKRQEWVLSFGGLNGHEHDRAGRLPLGLRQRLALGCALVHQPKVLFLDEPTSGVDAIGRRAIWELLFRLSREQGVAILVTTHYMSEAEHCDRLALMHQGRIVANAAPDELKHAAEADAGQILQITSNRLDDLHGLLSQEGISNAFYGSSLHTFSKTPDQTIVRIEAIATSHGLRKPEMELKEMTMEDVFVYRMSQLEESA
ncbi:MAG TPA: ATP-binding cassette domain-containing protein [Fimbriimonas sp.]|nr:ATP-binding cassette domain-containing protein [Fimbriimonas sp.]